MYELDDGPLSQEQISLIREHSAATNIPDEKFTQTLLDGENDNS